MMYPSSPSEPIAMSRKRLNSAAPLLDDPSTMFTAAENAARRALRRQSVQLVLGKVLGLLIDPQCECMALTPRDETLVSAHTKSYAAAPRQPQPKGCHPVQFIERPAALSRALPRPYGTVIPRLRTRNAIRSACSSMTLLVGFPAPCPAFVSISISTGCEPACAAWSVAVNLNECPGTTRSS